MGQYHFHLPHKILSDENHYLWVSQSKPTSLNMEGNRAQLRRKTGRLLLVIYFAISVFVIAAYFIQNDLEQEGIIHDTQQERGITSILFLIFWSIACYQLFRYIIRAFDERSRVFDARESEHYALKEAARLREQFMANMSHEIRTPLNAIIGFSNLLNRSDLNGRERELSESIQVSSESLLSIVNDILDFSKIEAGMLVLEKVSFDPDNLFHTVQQMFVEKARQKNLTLDIHLAPGLPAALVGDPTRLTQILVNLIGNALKFTERGGVIVSVVQQTPVEDSDVKEAPVWLRIEVRDSGIGIAADQLERVFERFTQSDEQTTRLYGGTGLGLSIVKQLVTAMQGTITLQSETGKGSTFTVILPFEQELARALPVTPAPEQQNKALDFFEANLLVAEDNPMNCRVIELLFEEWQFRYTLVHNGQEAVELLKKDPTAFDLVLMDIQMPIMDGYEAARHIRRILHLKVPIVAMTAHVLSGERERCIQMGMNDYLPKPIREQELRELIARFVRETTSTPPPPIDRAYLRETTMGNLNHLRELTGIFLEQTPKDMEVIAAALSVSDLTAAARAAHNMKSTVGYMGFARSIGQQLSEFENACTAGSEVSVLQQNLAKIRETVEKARQLVQQEFMG